MHKKDLLSMAAYGSIATDSWVICETCGWLLETLDDEPGVTLPLSE